MKKLSLNELKVQSFVTSIGKTNSIMGGGDSGNPICFETPTPTEVCPESNPDCSFEPCDEVETLAVDCITEVTGGCPGSEDYKCMC